MLSAITKVVVVLTSDAGASLAHVARPADSSGRRYVAEVPENPDVPGWLPAGRYSVHVLVWKADVDDPARWQPMTPDRADGERALTLLLEDEPERTERVA